jgi:hypothetical protein
MEAITGFLEYLTWLIAAFSEIFENIISTLGLG